MIKTLITLRCKENVEKKLKDLIDLVKVIIIPDIESVNYGRGVGYEIIEHIPPSDISKISATKIGKNYLTESLICLIFAAAVPTFPTTLAAAALANLAENSISLVFAYATDKGNNGITCSSNICSLH